ncbi:MAG: TonB-dependent receptor plug domain-containing protein, partial [Gammaproteobacteria bacterium]|nr:TonB-dependent receptor plug domain-containing protein [Gammaproteobacteria bacterium]
MQKPILPARAGVFVVVVTLLSLLSSGGAQAQDRTDEEDDILTILITASRFAETADETLAPVTVITREEIEEKQAATLEEVLRTVPGVVLNNNGGVGKNTSLFLRGTASNNVLVLIDGVKIGSATNGATPFQHLPIDQ